MTDRQAACANQAPTGSCGCPATTCPRPISRVVRLVLGSQQPTRISAHSDVWTASTAACGSAQLLDDGVDSASPPQHAGWRRLRDQRLRPGVSRCSASDCPWNRWVAPRMDRDDGRTNRSTMLLRIDADAGARPRLGRLQRTDAQPHPVAGRSVFQGASRQDKLSSCGRTK